MAGEALMDIIVNNLIGVYFGEVWIFGLALIMVFFIVTTSIGMSFQNSAVLSVPIAVATSTIGLLGAKSWISDAVLVIVGITYAIIILRLINKGG